MQRDNCVYSYTADGKYRCVIGNKDLYDFSIMLTNPTTSEVFTQKQLTGVYIDSANRGGMKEIMRIGALAKTYVTARLVITDSTVYSDPSKKSLKVFVSYHENMKPVPVNFSNTITLADYYNRTAVFDIKDFNGAIVYVA
jgi:hypothetical protein